MDTKAVSANQAASTAATNSLRSKPEAEAAKPAISVKENKATATPTDLSATQAVQDTKPAVNTSGQTIGSTINTTA